MHFQQERVFHMASIVLVVGLLLAAFIATPTFAPLIDALIQRSHRLHTLEQTRAPAAEPPALLLLSADAFVLPIGSGASQVTARVRNATGQPLAGVTVHFQSELGDVSPSSGVSGEDGVVLATFTAQNTPGQARIMATADTLSTEAVIQLIKRDMDATANRLSLEFGANQLDPGQEAAVTVVLRDATGQPLANEVISIFGSMGEVNPGSALSDANGRVTAIFRAGGATGPATITALAGYAAESVQFRVGSPVQPPEKPAQPRNRLFLPLVSDS